MYNALRTIQTSVPKNILPTEVTVATDGSISLPPTNLLAVHSPRSSRGAAKTSVVLYPAHAVVLAATCANLPPLPSSASGDEKTRTLPVTPLCLPDATTFPVLLEFLYCHNKASFVSALLRPAGMDRRVAASRVLGLWRNACALGVCDESLWDAINVAWAAVVGVKA
jgi:hypothetical protein